MVKGKWTELLNTTIGVLMAVINSSIIFIVLTSIFKGMGVNLLLPRAFAHLLWFLWAI